MKEYSAVIAGTCRHPLTWDEHLKTIPTNDFKFSIARLSEIINYGRSWIFTCKP